MFTFIHILVASATRCRLAISAKPSDEFFKAVKNGIPDFNREKTLIIGDSLVSDIPLGLKNGIKTCRANYRKEGNPENVKYDYEIFNLSEIFAVLGEEND